MSRRTRTLVLAAVLGSAAAVAGLAPTPVPLASPAAAQEQVTAYDPNSPAGSIYRLYRAYFLREPDQLGFNHWVNAHAHGYPLGAISNDFARSAEFQDRYGDLDDPAFLDRVYRNVLGRSPDSGGYGYWLAQMEAGMQRGFLMLYFSDSAEFRAKTVDGVPPGYDVVTHYEVDVERIKRLWREQSEAFETGTGNGFMYMTAHNYPGMGSSYETCRTWAWPHAAVGRTGEQAPDGYVQTVGVYADTVERDDTWTVPDGPLAGENPDGRVYRFRMVAGYLIPEWTSFSVVSEGHATVLPDGSAKFFMACYR